MKAFDLYLINKASLAFGVSIIILPFFLVFFYRLTIGLLYLAIT